MDVFCRRELKFLIDEDQRKALEQVFSEKMVPDRFGHSSIRNIYYDTPDFRLIRRSLEKPVYKEKLRLRCYGDGGPVFLEMKKKYMGIVYKRRVALTEPEAEAFLARRGSLPDTQIGREMVYFRDFYKNLQPQVYLSYERDAWFSKADPGLRITIDDDIAYRCSGLRLTQAPGGQAILPEGVSLMEVKAENAIPLWLTELLAGLKIARVSFSKYGRAYEQTLQAKLRENRGFDYVG